MNHFREPMRVTYFSDEEGVELLAQDEDGHQYQMSWDEVDLILERYLEMKRKKRDVFSSLILIPSHASKHGPCTTPVFLRSLVKQLSNIAILNQLAGAGSDTCEIDMFMGTAEELDEYLNP